MIWISKSLAKKKYNIAESVILSWCEKDEIVAKRSGRGWIVEEESLEKRIDQDKDRCRRMKRPAKLRAMGKNVDYASLPVSIISGGHREIEDPAVRLGFAVSGESYRIRAGGLWIAVVVAIVVIAGVILL